MPNPGWRESLWLSLKSETATWFSAVVIATVAALVPQITESVKLNINRSDLRSQLYEKLASDLSEYLFYCKIFMELLESGVTQKESLDQIIPDYNRAIVEISKKEFVYTAQLKRAWGKEAASNFPVLIKSVEAFDSALRELNSEFVNVRSGKSPNIDRDVIEQSLPRLRSSVADLREESTRMLSSLKAY